jgi:hypothetical protein
MDVETATSPALSNEEPQPLDVPREQAWGVAWKSMLAVLMLGLAAWIGLEGLRLRQYAWDHTEGVRFLGDVANGYSWGNNAKQFGLFYVFDGVQRGQLGSNLDYTPLRLTVVYLWNVWAEHRFPPQQYPQYTSWVNTYELTAPMLWFNTGCEIASSIFIFLLIWHWSTRKPVNHDPPRDFHWIFWGLVSLAVGALTHAYGPDAWASWAFLGTGAFAVVMLEILWSGVAGEIGRLDRHGVRIVGGLLLVVAMLLFDPNGWGSAASTMTSAPALNATALEAPGIAWAARSLPLVLAMPMLGTAFRGVSLATFGALLFWFNPAVIWDGHAWPQWDVWLVPFFLAAVLLASLDWWFAAGMLITIGGYLKGQMWLGAPILLIWPVFQFRFGAALRAVSGLIFAAAMIALPWMHPPLRGVVWYLLALLGMGCLVPFVFRWRWSPIATLVLAGIAPLLAWPWVADVSAQWKFTAIAVLPALALTRFVRPMLRPSIFALGVGIVLLLLMPLYGGSTAWYDVGFVGGASKYETMLTGNGTYNIPALFRTDFRWPNTAQDTTTLPLIGTVSYKQFAEILYGICLVLCGIGAAINARRGDRRFLVAMAAPWILFYIFLPQMHGRYLVWGAAMSALLAAESIGLGLIGLVVSVIAALGMITNQYNFESDWDRENYTRLMSLRPHLGWLLLLLGAIVLYHAFIPRIDAWRRRAEDEPLPLPERSIAS